MKSWFKKRNQTASADLIKELDSQVKQLNNQFARIEKVLEGLAGQSRPIHIENVHIHQPVLEKLEYRLDKLDIDVLSGSLNLGNNFGTKLGSLDPSDTSHTKNKNTPAAPHTEAKEHKPSSGSKNDVAPGLHRTTSGYRLRRS